MVLPWPDSSVSDLWPFANGPAELYESLSVLAQSNRWRTRDAHHRVCQHFCCREKRTSI